MISSSSAASLLSHLVAQAGTSTDTTASSASPALTANAKARVAATAAAALQTASQGHQASTAVRALDKQQSALAADLRSAMTRAGVKLSGAVDFSVGSDGKVGIQGSDADKAATAAFLKSDTGRPGFAARIATQARDALKVSAKIQQSAAVSQAARYGGGAGGVMSLYTSLMQQASPTTAVFTLSADSSSLTYPGSLATTA